MHLIHERDPRDYLHKDVSLLITDGHCHIEINRILKPAVITAGSRLHIR